MIADIGKGEKNFMCQKVSKESIQKFYWQQIKEADVAWHDSIIIRREQANSANGVT